MIQSKKKKILFISHESSLTGAPVLLLNLLSLVKKRGFFDIFICVYRGGILEKEFKKYGEVTILKSKEYHVQTFFLLRVINFLVYRLKLFFLSNEAKKFDIVFNNTLVNGKVLKALCHSNAKVITYVHELESVICKFRRDAEFTFKYSDFYCCPSNAVAENLIALHNIPSNKLAFLNYFFPLPPQKNESAKIDSRKRFKGHLQFKKNKFYVVGMGAGTYRKGIDIFIDAARIILQKDENIHFVWIGNLVDGEMNKKIFNDITDHHLDENITLVGGLPYSLENLLPFDLFVLPSREDPYPLVILEAALMEIPSVCFGNTGGIQEFIGTDSGWILNEISATLLATKILEIKNNKEELIKRGKSAFNKCIKLHTDENFIYEQFTSILAKA